MISRKKSWYGYLWGFFDIEAGWDFDSLDLTCDAVYIKIVCFVLGFFVEVAGTRHAWMTQRACLGLGPIF